MKRRTLLIVEIVLLVAVAGAAFASPAGAATIDPTPADSSFQLWVVAAGVVLVLCGVTVLRRALSERPLRQRAQDLPN